MTQGQIGTTIGIYLAFGLQSAGIAIGWQYTTYFLKHDLGVTSFLVMTAIFATPPLVMMIAMGFWGAVSDHFRTRKPFLLLGFVGWGSMYLFSSLVRTSAEFFVVSLVGTIFASAALPTGQALITSGTEARGERLGLLLAARSAGWFAGALSSGLLYDVIGMFVLFRISAMLCFGALVAGVILVDDIPPAPSLRSRPAHLFDILRRPGMTVLVLAVTLSTLGVSSITSIMAIIISDELGGPTSFVGFANAGATALAALITGYVGRITDRQGPARVLVTGFLSYVLFSVAFALVTDPLTAVILYSLPLYPLVATAASAFAALVSQEEERGRAMGLVNGAQNGGNAIGPIVGGWFADNVFLSAHPVVWLTMGFNLLALLLSLSLIGTVKRIRAQKGAVDLAPAHMIDEGVSEQIST